MAATASGTTSGAPAISAPAPAPSKDPGKALNAASKARKTKRFVRKATENWSEQPPIGRYPLENQTSSMGRPVNPFVWLRVAFCCMTCIPMIRLLVFALTFCFGYSYMSLVMCGHEGIDRISKEGRPMNACRRSMLAPVNWMLRTMFFLFGVLWIEEFYHDDSPYAIHCWFCCSRRSEIAAATKGADAEQPSECNPLTDDINTGKAGAPPSYGCGSLMWAIGARYVFCCCCPYLRSPDCPRVVAIGGHNSVFDILMVGSHFLPTITMKEEVTRFPFIGAKIASLAPILVPRSAEERKRLPPPAVQLVRRAHTAVEDPYTHPPILVFPEGTTAGKRWLLEFQRGAFLPGVPVQPVMLQYPGMCFDSTWTPDTDTLWLSLQGITSCFNRIQMRYLKPSLPTSAQRRDPYRWGYEVRRQLAVAACESEAASRAIPVPYSDHDSIMLNQFMRIGAGKYCMDHINAWKQDWGVGQLLDEEPWERAEGFRVSTGLNPGDAISELPSAQRRGMLIREGRKAAGLGVYQFTELALRFHDADKDKDGLIERGEFSEFLHPPQLREHLQKHDPAAAQAALLASGNKDRILALFDLLVEWGRDSGSFQSQAGGGNENKLSFRQCVLGLGVVLSSYKAMQKAQAHAAAEDAKQAGSTAGEEKEVDAGAGGAAAAAAAADSTTTAGQESAGKQLAGASAEGPVVKVDITQASAANDVARATAAEGMIGDPTTGVPPKQLKTRPGPIHDSAEIVESEYTTTMNTSTAPGTSGTSYDANPPVAGRHMTDKDIGRLLRAPSNLEMGAAAIASTTDLRARMLFAIFDEDGDGELNRNELKALLVAADRARMLQAGEEDELIEVVASGGGAGTSTPSASPISPRKAPTRMRRAASIRVEQEVTEMLDTLQVPQPVGAGEGVEKVDFNTFKQLCDKKEVFERLLVGAGWWFGSILSVEL